MYVRAYLCMSICMHVCVYMGVCMYMHACTLGVYFDTHLTTKAHIARVSRTCFYHLRRLRSIRGCLGREVTAQLVSAYIISRLDYCYSILANLPASTQAPLQRVFTAAARTSTSQQCAFASAGPLLWNCL